MARIVGAVHVEITGGYLARAGVPSLRERGILFALVRWQMLEKLRHRIPHEHVVLSF